MNQLAVPLSLVALIFTGCAAPVAEGPPQEPPLQVRWAAAPGEQASLCTRLAVDEPLDIAGIDVNSPPGTQRLRLWHSGQADPSLGCPDVDTQHLLFDGIDALEMPPGVALRVPSGRDLWLRVDVVNDTDASLEGASGVILSTTDEANELADVVSLAADVAGEHRCEMPETSFLFAIAPNVASSAHLRLTAHSSFAGGDVTLFDGGGASGARWLTKPVALLAGEAVEASCLPSDGLSSTVAHNAAACQVALYRFPAAATGCW